MHESKGDTVGKPFSSESANGRRQSTENRIYRCNKAREEKQVLENR